jgi:glutathione S-transferase
MRARLAVAASGIEMQLREVVLRDKPAEMLEASPKGTVPVLVLPDGEVIEQSLDVMNWALSQHDPEDWRNLPDETLKEIDVLIGELDGPFKSALDRYKYENRYDGVVAMEQRDLALPFLQSLDARLTNAPYLFGDRFTIADAAVAPFVRQFAHVDRDWFWAQDWPNLIGWLEAFLVSNRFQAIMKKHPKWQTGEPGVRFPIGVA